MATVVAGSKKGGRDRKALLAVPDNDANISAGKADAVPSSVHKTKRAPSKSSKAKATLAAAAAAAEASPVAAPTDGMAELQGMLKRLRLEMMRERDEVIRRKEEEIETREKEQERLHAQLPKVQRVKEFKPTVSLPFVKLLLEKDQEGDDK